MEVKPGYKQTQAGIIPGDWELKQIGELKPFVTSGSRGWARFYSERGSPFIRITNLSRDHISLDLRKLRFVDIDQNEPEAGRTQLQDGDILISITADIGMIGHVSASLSKPAYINQHIALVRFDPSRVDSKFVGYFLTTERPQRLFRFLTDAGAKAGMNLTTVQQIHVAVPPTVAEQHAIAEALSDADALIESLEQLIAKNRRLKQGAMQELLTGKTRLSGFELQPGYKHTEAGVIPEDWKVANLSSVSKEPMQNGVFYKPSLKGVGVKLINVGDLYGRTPIDSDALALFNASAIERERFKVENGDLFFTRSSVVPSGIAHCNFYRASGSECVVFDSHVIRMRPDTKKVVSAYLFRFCIASVARRYLVSHAKTGTMTTIDQQVLAKCPVILPSIAEQEAIAGALSDLDAGIGALEAELVKARQIKQGIMQELLTGRIRLL